MSLPSIMWLKGAGVAPLPSMTFNTSSTIFTGTTTRTYSNINIGTADSTRLVVVPIGSAQPTTTVTIGGITATKAVSQSNSSQFVSIWYATVTTGTTANIVVSSSLNPGNELIGSYSLYNLSSNTPFNTNSSNAGSSGGITVTVNVPSNGILIANTSSDSPGTLSITTSQTLNYQQGFGGGCCPTQLMGGASASNLASGTGVSVNFHVSSNFAFASNCVATWN